LDTRVMIIAPGCMAMTRRKNGDDYNQDFQKAAHARLMHESFLRAIRNGRSRAFSVTPIPPGCTPKQ
jgi:hypothetical protein